MNQSIFPFDRRPKVYAKRDFPRRDTQLSDENQRNGITSEDDGCGNVANQNYHRPKEAGFNVAANGSKAGRRRFVPAKRTFPPSSSDSKVKRLSPEETIELVASHGKRIRLSETVGNSERIQIQRNSPETMVNVVAPRDERRSNQAVPVTQPKNQTAEVLSPREKVLDALGHFWKVFRELDRDKAARRGSMSGTSRIDYKTRSVLVEMKRQVNSEKRIGSVPGINVGDEFQYKAELNIIGLHFGIMGGIDYIDRGDLTLATSIVASEGYGYTDTFESDVVIYSGEGGNVINKNQNMVEDQKLVKGNLALANSMRAQKEVRVIRGLKRFDNKGKHYVYDGLYLVKDYWPERGSQDNILFKFKLIRVPGQPSIDWKKHL